jgi:WXG100 family type VII secretion target
MLSDAANKATQAGESITLNLTRLLNEIESQAGSFQGGAGTSFQSVSQELGGQLRNILEALNEMAGNVSSANQLFGSTDADAAEEIKQVVNEYLPGADSSVVNALRGA